jgi:hypothetical protein
MSSAISRTPEMAKDTKQPDHPASHEAHPPPHEAHPAPPKAPGPRGGTWIVTFPGLAPVTVEASSAEEAVAVAAEKLGVLASETKPEVIPG